MRPNFLLIIIILMLAVVIALSATLPQRILRPKDTATFTASSSQIDYANKLLSKGLKNEAAEAYEEYISSAVLHPQEESLLLYKLGSIYMELYRYEKALKSFYKAEMLQPQAPFNEEMDKR